MADSHRRRTKYSHCGLDRRAVGLTVIGCVAGVLGCPRSCLHAILSLLQKGTERRSGPVITQQAPHLAELCYQVRIAVLGSTPSIYSQYLSVFFFFFLAPSLR